MSVTTYSSAFATIIVTLENFSSAPPVHPPTFLPSPCLYFLLVEHTFGTILSNFRRSKGTITNKKKKKKRAKKMQRDASSSNTYNYGDVVYWDARYLQESSATFDWYQRYSALRPLIRHYVPTSSRVLMVGSGNAVMSEDMVKDGYEDIVNIDISSLELRIFLFQSSFFTISIDMQMDVRDMSFFPDESFDNVMDKGTLDSLMCGTSAPLSAAQMLGEVSRLLKPGGTYILITYGDPLVRVPHLSRAAYCWHITLYIIPRPGFQRSASTSSSPAKSLLEPVPISENGLLPADFVLEDPDSHFIYVCKKMDEAELACSTSHLLMPNVV
ncbi:hypothetical protein Sjap_012836 [Stephania japonica]|uniref:Methyltransferase type 11 domain-containing protein n=1 Tax=Stephania japonica TaxID=461633 RepID=A0AAP0NYN9_9MAGN